MRLRWRSHSLWRLRVGEVIRVGTLRRWDLTGQVVDRTYDTLGHTVAGHLRTPDGDVVPFSLHPRVQLRCQRLVAARRDEVAAVYSAEDPGHFVGLGTPRAPTGWVTTDHTIVTAKPAEHHNSLDDAVLAVLWAKSQGQRWFIESPGDPGVGARDSDVTR